VFPTLELTHADVELVILGWRETVACRRSDLVIEPHRLGAHLLALIRANAAHRPQHVLDLLLERADRGAFVIGIGMGSSLMVILTECSGRHQHRRAPYYDYFQHIYLAKLAGTEFPVTAIKTSAGGLWFPSCD
jgi:hypothetical protein